MENTKMLKNIFIFRGLSQIQLAQFNKVLTKRTTREGERVIGEGDAPEQMYIVVDGTYRVLKEWGNQEEVLAEMSRGEHFGEIALIDHGPRSASVESVTDGEVLCLSRADFERILKDFPDARVRIYENFLESLCERLRSSNENLLVAAEARGA